MAYRPGLRISTKRVYTVFALLLNFLAVYSGDVFGDDIRIKESAEVHSKLS